MSSRSFRQCADASGREIRQHVGPQISDAMLTELDEWQATRARPLTHPQQGDLAYAKHERDFRCAHY